MRGIQNSQYFLVQDIKNVFSDIKHYNVYYHWMRFCTSHHTLSYYPVMCSFNTYRLMMCNYVYDRNDALYV